MSFKYTRNRSMNKTPHVQRFVSDAIKVFNRIQLDIEHYSQVFSQRFQLCAICCIFIDMWMKNDTCLHRDQLNLNTNQTRKSRNFNTSLSGSISVNGRKQTFLNNELIYLYTLLMYSFLYYCKYNMTSMIYCSK